MHSSQRQQREGVQEGGEHVDPGCHSLLLYQHMTEKSAMCNAWDDKINI